VSPSELLASPSELSAPRSELLASPSAPVCGSAASAHSPPGCASCAAPLPLALPAHTCAPRPSSVLNFRSLSGPPELALVSKKMSCGSWSLRCTAPGGAPFALARRDEVAASRAREVLRRRLPPHDLRAPQARHTPTQVANRNSRVLARRDREWSLNDGQIPNPDVVCVAPGTGYRRADENRRASRNGPVSDLPPRNPQSTIRCTSATRAPWSRLGAELLGGARVSRHAHTPSWVYRRRGSWAAFGIPPGA
jgi:hypothetical protein